MNGGIVLVYASYYVFLGIIFMLGVYFFLVGIWELNKGENKKRYMKFTLIGMLLLYLTYVVYKVFLVIVISLFS